MAIAALSVLHCPRLLTLTRFLAVTSYLLAPSSPAGKTHARAGYSHSLGSMQCNNQSSDIPLHSADLCEDKGRHVGCACEDQCNPQGQASCMGLVQGKAAPFYHFTSKPGRTGKKTTGKSKISGLMPSSSASHMHRATLYQTKAT